MTSADVHQILILYLYAGAATSVIVVIAAVLRKAKPEARSDRARSLV